MSEIVQIKSKHSWNKTDLTVLLATEAQIPKVRAAHYINILTDTIAEALESGKKVTISDFGTFQVSERRSFAGRNPKTGAPLQVPVRRIPVFRAGKRLKTSLNTPQIKECHLVDANKVRVRFSKLMDENSELLLDASSYDVLVDGQNVGPVQNVEIMERITEVRILDEIEKTHNGVRSVVLQCPNRLVGRMLQVKFTKPIFDVDGNTVKVD